ncbi:MAG: YdbL family protein [Steroidobacteraceae bacterium]
MRKLLPLKIALASMLVAACVTINVYFPAAAAEKAADQLIDTVTQGANKGTINVNPPAQTPGQAPPTSRAAPAETPLVLLAAGRVLELLIPAAQAQEPNLDVSTPEVRAITASMTQRFGQLTKYFDSGVVGLTADGLIEVRDANSAPLAERATVKRLVAEDNQDRASLYAAIAKGNGHPEWEPQIRKTFARRWIERGAKTGWYYQNSSGAWVQK